MYQRSLHRFSVFVAAATLCLLIAGGLVTSTGSGLSVPDWPLSYGRFFPPMIGGIRFEHSHRVIAGLVGILTFVLTFWVLKKEKRVWMKWLGVAAAISVILQAILGGLTVKYLLPTPVSVAHACLGQTFFCIVSAIALFTSREWVETSSVPSESAGSLHRILITTLIFIYLQLIAGSVVRHTAGHHGIRFHFVLAFLIFLHIFLIVVRIARGEKEENKLLGHAALLGGFAITQIFLGFGSFVYKFMLPPLETPRLGEVLLTTAHQTTGAMILAGTLLLLLRSLRMLTTPRTAKIRKMGSWRDYLDLTKPRLTLLAVATTLLGYFIASKSPFNPALLFHTLLASLLIGAAANALNQFLERDIDPKMKRTEIRPLPTGKMDAKNAFLFGAVLSTLGLLEFFIYVNTLTAALGLITLLTYLFCYTPLKRKTYLNTFVGAISGALPCVMGWTAAKGSVGLETAALFAILFIWQLPHFFAIAWVYRDDYKRSGLKMLSLDDTDGSITAKHIVLYSALLLPASLIPALLGMSGSVYFFTALSASLVFSAFALFMLFDRLTHAKRFVSVSIYYLLVIIIMMMVDKKI